MSEDVSVHPGSVEGIGVKLEDHTPGPWEISEAKTVEDTFMVVGGEGFGFGLIAEVTTEADARLIAAAPDLVAFAITYDDLMLASWPNGPDGHPATLHEADANVWRRCRAAIAKALTDDGKVRFR